jgi:hypothetical protein
MRLSPIYVSPFYTAGLAGLLWSSQATASPECKDYGQATYQATRTVDIGGKLQTGTVYVSGDSERDETTGPDGKPAIHIKTPQRIVTFSPTGKTGIILPVPPRREPPKADASTQIERTTAGDTHILIVKKKIGDAWVQVYRSVCRKDGVLLERDFPVPSGEKMITAKMRHTAIEVRDVPADRFVVPADVKLLEPPPRKP